jgi:hypothetical protein
MRSSRSPCWKGLRLAAKEFDHENVLSEVVLSEVLVPVLA